MKLLKHGSPRLPLSRPYAWASALTLLLYAQSVRSLALNKPRIDRNATYSTVEEYRQRRADLIAEERALRFDAERIRNVTSREARAVEIVDVIRRHEEENIWRADPNKEPGMPFLWAKNIIAQTELFKVIKKMPKGGLLHAHLDAMCDVSYLLKLALDYPIIHVRTTSTLNGSAPYPLPTFKPLPRREVKEAKKNALPTSQDYLGAQAGFDKWITDALTINAEETYSQYNSSAKVWEKFGSTFAAGAGILRYEPIWRRYVDQLLVSQIEDGISYVEIRLSFDPTLPVISEDATRNLTNSQVVNLTISAIDEVSRRMREQGREKDFVGARGIYTTGREISYEAMVQALDDCLALKSEYPEFLVGFDMVDQEDAGHPLVYFLEALLNFRAEADKRGLDIPFMFHAGETLDDGGEVDSNLYDALLLGSKRIGHGFSLTKHPLLMQKYRENGIAVEVCPISNEILRFTRSANTHPLPILLNNGVAVALSSDDPSVFHNPGLSFDFYQVIVASNITNLLSLGQLARQSLEYSSLNTSAKRDVLKIWEERCGVPTSGDLFPRNDSLPSINEYLERRADLIAEERAIRFDTGAIQNATAKEQSAVEIVDALRRRKQESIWYANPDKELGTPYLWAKDTIAQTDLFKLIKKMPKGALLHAHSDAMVDAKYLFQLTLDYPSIHLRTASALNSSGPFPTPIFRPLSQTEADQYLNNSLPTSPDYVPNSWISAQRFREGFPSELGGKDGFDKWIISSMTISADDTYVQYNTTAKGLTRYEPIYRRYLNQLLASQIEDGISYVEIRLGYSPARTVISEDGTRNLTNSQVLDITQSIIDGVKTSLQKQGRGDEFVGARVR
ncbi:hypothetical protein OPQ81_011311 [Rhizoctonia solani]|nr:hypothetical protein OPQ81_011311 [Rhizoctonia solani]